MKKVINVMKKAVKWYCESYVSNCVHTGIYK